MVFFKKALSGPPQVIKTSYTSNPVTIPSDFLSCAKTNPTPITYTKIDFSTTPLPEYHNRYAVVLDNVLSPDECQQLIHFAEQSTGAHAPGAEIQNDGWKPALINAGDGFEIAVSDYRNSDRIIWDEKDVAERIWQRCLLAPELKEDLEVLEGEASKGILGRKAVELGHRWRVTRLNERMRFLRYGKGQYFRPHCDGTYETPDQSERTFYTLHLYLNDSQQASPSSDASPTLRGGATTFHALASQFPSATDDRRMDIDPRAGRVLIFQHTGLLHSGDEVLAGVKYTMRTDILYAFDETCGASLKGKRAGGKK